MRHWHVKDVKLKVRESGDGEISWLMYAVSSVVVEAKRDPSQRCMHIQALTPHPHSADPHTFKGYSSLFCPLGLYPPSSPLLTPISHSYTSPVFVVLSSLWLISAPPPNTWGCCLFAIRAHLPLSLQSSKLMTCIHYLMALLYHFTGCRPLWKTTQSQAKFLWYLFLCVVHSLSLAHFLLPPYFSTPCASVWCLWRFFSSIVFACFTACLIRRGFYFLSLN